jgi:hypothetical protein
MKHKKADAKPASRTRLSQASRWLGGALRDAMRAPVLEQPWWKRKQKVKNQGKR